LISAARQAGSGCKNISRQCPPTSTARLQQGHLYYRIKLPSKDILRIKQPSTDNTDKTAMCGLKLKDKTALNMIKVPSTDK
jgi:hypothetical protein